MNRLEPPWHEYRGMRWRWPSSGSRSGPPGEPIPLGNVEVDTRTRYGVKWGGTSPDEEGAKWAAEGFIDSWVSMYGGAS